MAADGSARTPTSTPQASSPMRMILWCVSAALVSAALLPMLPRAAGSRAPLTLEIAGDLSRVAADGVRHAVAVHLNTEFHALDLASVKTVVEAMPWVARARVERAWPSAVRVRVWEHQPYARWGARAVLSTENVVFMPPALDDDVLALPRLDGPTGQQALVRAAWESLNRELAPTPFAPTGLALNARGEWLATTVDGIELRLGRGVPLDAVARLTGPVRTALEGRLQEVSYVDLHYFNGFAVGWRDERGDPNGVTRVAENGHGHE